MNLVDAWFERRGRKPFRFQRSAWKSYREGASGLIHAPTGHGKTLAAWLGPIRDWLERNPPANEHLDSTSPTKSTRDASASLEVIWLTPLRALANDTLRSLMEPIEALRLPWSVELRTGDVSSTIKQRQRNRLPTALVTTPESLTLLLSYPDAHTRFRTLRAVIVDEWHELLGTKRGVQTELALARLRTWCPTLRTWGLSATIGNVDEAARVLLGASAAQAKIIAGPKTKRIEVETLFPKAMDRFPWSGHLGQQLVPQVLDLIEAARSTLLFTNTRSQAEQWFQLLMKARPDWLGQIALHHGSLERDVRTRVEQMLGSGELRAVVCTSSMDLGVDFAPVDQVLQLGSPKGIARLMQRAGRSGHQPGKVSRIVCVPTHSFELIEFAAARAGVEARRIESRTPLEKPLDVLIQHLVTIATGGGFFSDKLLKEVRRTSAYQSLTDQEWDWTLNFVAEGGQTLNAYPEYRRLIRDEQGKYQIRSPKLERMHRINIGTITSDSSLRVAMGKGRTLGTIEESFIGKLAPGDIFTFAGRLLMLKNVRNMTAYVAPAKARRGVIPRWHGGRFPLSTHLGQAVREQLEAARNGIYASRELAALRPLLELQADSSRLPRQTELLIETTTTREGQHWFVFPFEGRAVHEGLSSLLAYRLSQRFPATIKIAANDYGIELLSSKRFDLDGEVWTDLIRADDLARDLLACLNETQLARRQFRDIARIAGLLVGSFPGQQKSTRQLQMSSELFFDVFQEFDADNLLLSQARTEVLQQQLRYTRLEATLERLSRGTIVVTRPKRLSPLAFPLWAERLRAQYVSSESWTERVARMAAELESRAKLSESSRSR